MPRRAHSRANESPELARASPTCTRKPANALLLQALRLIPLQAQQGPTMAPKADPSEIKVRSHTSNRHLLKCPRWRDPARFFPLDSTADQTTSNTFCTDHLPQGYRRRGRSEYYSCHSCRQNCQASRTESLTSLASVGLVCSCAQDRSPRSCKLRSHIGRNARATYEVGIGWERRGVEAVGGQRTA